MHGLKIKISRVLFTLGIPLNDFEISESSVDSSVRQFIESIIHHSQDGRSDCVT